MNRIELIIFILFTLIKPIKKDLDIDEPGIKFLRLSNPGDRFLTGVYSERLCRIGNDSSCRLVTTCHLER